MERVRSKFKYNVELLKLSSSICIFIFKIQKFNLFRIKSVFIILTTILFQSHWPSPRQQTHSLSLYLHSDSRIYRWNHGHLHCRWRTCLCQIRSSLLCSAIFGESKSIPAKYNQLLWPLPEHFQIARGVLLCGTKVRLLFSVNCTKKILKINFLNIKYFWTKKLFMQFFHFQKIKFLSLLSPNFIMRGSKLNPPSEEQSQASRASRAHRRSRRIQKSKKSKKSKHKGSTNAANSRVSRKHKKSCSVLKKKE